MGIDADFGWALSGVCWPSHGVVHVGAPWNSYEMAHTIQITFDAADPYTLGEFWCEVLGYVREAPPDKETWPEQLEYWGVPVEDWNSRNVIVDPRGNGPRVFFQRVPEPKTAKNRVHLDVRTAEGLRGDERMEELRGRARQLCEKGATIFREFPPDGVETGFIVMQDPEGNEFCLA